MADLDCECDRAEWRSVAAARHPYGFSGGYRGSADSRVDGGRNSSPCEGRQPVCGSALDPHFFRALLDRCTAPMASTPGLLEKAVKLTASSLENACASKGVREAEGLEQKLR